MFMLALILACTITTPCIYIEPNPTLPGITNMAGGPDITKDMTHELQPTQSTPLVRPRPSQNPPLPPPRTSPPAHGGTQFRPSTRPQTRPTFLEHYTIQPGDCLYTIALHYQTTWQTLWGLNPGIVDPNLIWPGEVIALP